MLHTYFVLLNADYIMAEGSFQGLMKYMEKGYSAICAGNFQVIENEIKPFLKHHTDSVNQVMKIPPREFLQESFQHFHPVTRASIIQDKNNLHNYRVNRFFFQEDRHTLAGRFYLLHVLCIKPETTDYQIGCSFDYSYVPEMCPSGNMGVIDDSDDYLVIEMQPKKHELQSVNLGPYNLQTLSLAMCEWTTEQHRKNAEHIIYYHSNDLSTETKDRIKARSDQFINKLMLGLQKYKIQPYRQHPYWIGAVDSFDTAKTVIKENDASQYLDLSLLDYASKWRKLYYRFLGYPPSTNRFHYRWREFRSVKETLHRFISNQPTDKTVALYSANERELMGYCGWLKNDLKVEHHYHVRGVTHKDIFKTLQTKQFENCLFFIRFQDIKKIKSSLAVIKSMLAPHGKVLIFICNDHNNSPMFLYNLEKKFISKMHYFAGSDYSISEIIAIHNNYTFLGAAMIKWINNKFDYSRQLRFLFYFLIGMPGMFLTFVRNRLIGNTSLKKGHCTNILVSLSPEGEETH